MKITCSKCDGFLELNKIGTGAAYCNPCFAEWQRDYRKYGNKRSQEEKQKVKARSLAHAALRQGKLKRLPCEVCKNDNTEFHHEDYSKPLDVRHFCRPCHLEWHNAKKLEKTEIYELSEVSNDSGNKI